MRGKPLDEFHFPHGTHLLRAVRAIHRACLDKHGGAYVVTAVHVSGEFVELEVVMSTGDAVEDGIGIAGSLMTRLGIDPNDLVEKSYIDLIEEANVGVDKGDAYG